MGPQLKLVGSKRSSWMGDEDGLKETNREGSLGGGIQIRCQIVAVFGFFKGVSLNSP